MARIFRGYELDDFLVQGKRPKFCKSFNPQPASFMTRRLFISPPTDSAGVTTTSCSTRTLRENATSCLVPFRQEEKEESVRTAQQDGAIAALGRLGPHERVGAHRVPGAAAGRPHDAARLPRRQLPRLAQPAPRAHGGAGERTRQPL